MTTRSWIRQLFARTPRRASQGSRKPPRCRLNIDVLEDRFAHVPQDTIVPGILKVADIPEIVEALSPRSVLLERTIDGRNRPTQPGAGETDLASWLAARLTGK